MYVIYKIFCSFLLFFFPFIYLNPHQKAILYIITKICEESKFIKNGRTKTHSSINKWTSVAALPGPNVMLTFHSAVSIPASQLQNFLPFSPSCSGLQIRSTRNHCHNLQNLWSSQQICVYVILVSKDINKKQVWVFILDASAPHSTHHGLGSSFDGLYFRAFKKFQGHSNTNLVEKFKSIIFSTQTSHILLGYSRIPFSTLPVDQVFRDQ